MQARENQGELAGKTAVVTGASSGIGRAIALELAQAGAHVLVHARSRQAEAGITAAAVRAQGSDARIELCDLAEPEGPARLFAAAWNWRGGVDIWVNNAGADVLTGPQAGLSYDEKLHMLWRVDVRAALLLSRQFGEQIKARGGPPGAASLVNVGWDQAQQGMAGESGELFAAAKGAVLAFTRSLAQSLAPLVRVNCVAPGWIRTAWGETASASWDERARRDALLARWGTPADVAAAVRFLVSPAASFVNGQVLAVNGGFRFSALPPG